MRRRRPARAWVFRVGRRAWVTPLRRVVQETGFDVRRHNDVALGGLTLLHIAAWNGHVELTHFLLSRLPPEQRVAYASAVRGGARTPL